MSFFYRNNYGHYNQMQNLIIGITIFLAIYISPISGSGVVEGSGHFLSSTVYADNLQNRGIFVTFTAMNIASLSYGCEHYVMITRPSGAYIFICGTVNGLFQVFNYSANEFVSHSHFTLGEVFYFDDSYITVQFGAVSQPSPTSSWFSLWYYSGKFDIFFDLILIFCIFVRFMFHVSLEIVVREFGKL
jgi:hypothetical protein